MSGRLCKTMLAFLIISVSLQGEVIRFSGLQQHSAEFKIRRDLFSPVKAAVDTGAVKPALPVPEYPPARDSRAQAAPGEPEDRIRQSIVYEGFVMRRNMMTVILSVDGEYFIAGQGDNILNKIQILRVERRCIFVEVDSRRIEIPLKGAEDEG